MENKSSTSFREQVIFYYVQKFYCDAVNRYKHPTVGELDIYIPSIDVAIEYDGSYWHKDRLNRDNEKNVRAKESGIRLIRIREYKLLSTEKLFGEIYLPKSTFKLYDVAYLNQIFHELGILIDNYDLMQYVLDEDDYKRNLPQIYSRIYDMPVENNLEDMCGIESWNREFNGKLIPENIPKDAWAYAVLKCKAGKNIELPRYHREYKSQCKRENENICSNCVADVICPLMRWCRGTDNQIIDCKVVDDAVYRMINSGLTYYRMELSSCLSEWLWEKSTLGIRIINEALLLKKNDSLRRNYIRFFGFKTGERDDGISSTNIFVRDENEKKLLERFAEELPYTKLSVHIFQRR